MDVSPEKCQTIANVLVVVMLALVLDRRAIVAMYGKAAPMLVTLVGAWGLFAGVQGSDEGFTGFSGVAIVVAFTFATAGMLGGLVGTIATDSQKR